jgi:hypothetical protein
VTLIKTWVSRKAFSFVSWLFGICMAPYYVYRSWTLDLTRRWRIAMPPRPPCNIYVWRHYRVMIIIRWVLGLSSLVCWQLAQMFAGYIRHVSQGLKENMLDRYSGSFELTHSFEFCFVLILFKKKTASCRKPDPPLSGETQIVCLLCCVHRMALISVPFIQWPQT